MIELEAGIALRIYQGDHAATPTVASTLAYAHDMVSKPFKNAPSFLALADEALAYKSFRFERLAVDHNSALSMLEHAHVLIRSCWLRYARIMILAGESKIVGAGSDDGVIASCRQLELLRSELDNFAASGFRVRGAREFGPVCSSAIRIERWRRRFRESGGES